MAEFYQGQLPPVVDLWLISTATLEATAKDALTACLSPAEQTQLQHIQRPAAQRQFLLSRGCLRHLLSRYTGQAPAALTFTYGPKGKPELSPSGDHTAPQPRFNLSHSGQRLLVAISTANAISALGVDIEALRPVRQRSRLCSRYLTPAEAATVLTLPPAAADHQFLRYWTGKEACLKALGLGIADAIQTLELILEPPRLTSTPAPIEVVAGGAHPEQLYQWQPEPGYIGAIALQTARLGPPRWRLWPTTPAAIAGDETAPTAIPQQPFPQSFPQLLPKTPTP
ncbi:4'-phosphopantetheinyl transferase family protein [Nodosilinea sp. PGN35]|uniref:4'-phosphopantetheinyl transferase family protein n=1 Tax=Nodosilinea sp. PGN35 TaxID=3020489 RepID=UPI0023B21168|nr:4'-phosphopantetheinyl transferase superfamily protein [Nodosilinea sp. TSF1-S3]MDF0365877.1 4'-phosphopantetheinyl transferase superfamily protein [Nodosilinea sp. TSF1-S3]